MRELEGGNIETSNLESEKEQVTATKQHKIGVHTVEKIGGTSMTAFDAVLENIFLRPENPYLKATLLYAGHPYDRDPHS